tara:strand:- start:507 stop:767 length:261 start_codon:yes stop_codon:yes gene_type:complete
MKVKQGSNLKKKKRKKLTLKYPIGYGALDALPVNTGFIIEGNKRGLSIDKNEYGVKVLIESEDGWTKAWIAGSTSVKKLHKERRNE